MTHTEFEKLSAERKDKLRESSIEAMGAFDFMQTKILKEGNISLKNKELIAIGIGISIRCMQCITLHVKKGIEAGMTREELVEVIEVAIMMGGGPSTSYGAIALEVFDEFASK